MKISANACTIIPGPLKIPPPVNMIGRSATTPTTWLTIKTAWNASQGSTRLQVRANGNWGPGPSAAAGAGMSSGMTAVAGPAAASGGTPKSYSGAPADAGMGAGSSMAYTAGAAWP